jgi:hypothetical protein
VGFIRCRSLNSPAGSHHCDESDEKWSISDWLIVVNVEGGCVARRRIGGTDRGVRSNRDRRIVVERMVTWGSAQARI